MKFINRILLLCLFSIIAFQNVQSQEFLVRDETFTWETAEDSYFGGNGFHWWRDYSTYPYNWVSPHNYSDGKFYYRYEVISQPTTKDFSLMFLLWQFQEDGIHRETGDVKVSMSGGAGSVTEYSGSNSPNEWWDYPGKPLVDFSKVGAYSNQGQNRMGLALWSDANCIPSSWGSGGDFCNDRKSDYFPMQIRITIVAVADGHSFSGWNNYVSGGGGGTDITFTIDFYNETTSQAVPSTYEYSYNQSSWTAGSGNKLNLTPGQTVYFRKEGTTDVQTLTVPSRPSTPSFSIDYYNETTNQTVTSAVEYDDNSGFSNSNSGNGSKVDLIPGTDFYFRQAATGSSFQSNTFQLNVPDRPAAPGSYGIDFINETTSSNVPVTIEYSSDEYFNSVQDATGIKLDLTPGENLYFRIKATSTAFYSTSTFLEVPGRTTPNYGVDLVNMTTNKPVDANDEHSTNSDMSGAVSGTNVVLPLTTGVDVYFRSKATASSFVSNIQHLEVAGKPDAPSFEVDYLLEKTKTIIPSTVEYDDNIDMTSPSSGNGSKINLIPGTDFYFRVKETQSAPPSNIFQLVVDSRPAAPTSFGVNYIDETTQNNVPATIEYATNTNFSGANPGSNSPIDITPGSTYYFRYKATASAFASEDVSQIIPARPAAPSVGINYSLETSSVVIPDDMEYASSSNFSGSQIGTGVTIPILPGNDKFFRYIATDGHFSSATYALDVPARGIPDYGINFINRTTNKAVSANDEYSLNSDMSSPSNGNSTAISLTPGTSLYFRSKASASAFRSNVQALQIPELPATPSYSIDFPGEQTSTNVPSTVEYSINSNMSQPTTASGTKVKLTPGTDLYFRVKSTGSSFASEPFFLDVPSRSAAPGPYTIDYANEQTSNVVPATVEYSSNSEMTGATSGNGTKLNLTPGTDLFFRTKAASGFASANYLLTVPDRPDAPIIGISYTDETTNVTIGSGTEYSTAANFSGASSGTGVKIPIVPGSTYYFRIKSISNAFKSQIKTLSIPARPSNPVFSVDFVNETTKEVVLNSVEYSDKSNLANSIVGAGTKIPLNPGINMYFRKLATVSTFKSGIETLSVANRPSTPGFTINYSTETTVENIPSTVLYSVNSNFTGSNSGTGVKITVTPGTTLYFKTKETANSFASSAQMLQVSSRPAAPSVTIDFLNEKTNENIDNTIEFATSNSFTGAQIATGNKVSLTPGTDLYFRKKASTSSFISSVTFLDIPVRPTIASTVGDTTTLNPIKVDITFPSVVSDFTIGDLLLTNASAQSLTGTYKVDIIPVAPRNVTVNILANAVPTGNFASAQFKTYFKKSTNVSDKISNSGISIYPNPAGKYFYVESTKKSEPSIRVDIFNALGTLVLSATIENSSNRIDIQNLPVGVYFVKLKNGVNIQTIKLVKE